MQPTEFYQNHLNQVSRSFALVISKLQGHKRLYISHAYLLFRVIDTIEDSTLPEDQKIDFLNLIRNSLETLHFSDLIEAKLSGVFQNAESADEKLVQDYRFLHQDFRQFPESIRLILLQAAQTMISGMISHLSLFSSQSLRLRSTTELNHYCFFVAGVVGEMLTRIMSDVHGDPKFTRDHALKSISFGLFLQKINILKDEVEDKDRQVSYFDRAETIYPSLLQNILVTQDYIKSIPRDWTDYRVFCLFSAGLGLISLAQKKMTPFVPNIALNRDIVIEYFTELQRLVTQSVNFDLLEAVQIFFTKFNFQFDIAESLATLTLSNPVESTSTQTPEQRYSLDATYFGVLDKKQLHEILSE